MKRCAFLSMENLEGFFSYDQLLVEPLSLRGWDVSFVPWRARVGWERYDAVVIRTTWDYYRHPREFVAVLKRIASQTRLENPLKIVLWNLDKEYLLDLDAWGVPIIPTMIADRRTTGTELWRSIRNFGTAEVVVKPAISANSSNTHRIRIDSLESRKKLASLAPTGRWLIQPLIASVLDEGELSLFYFGGHFSHAISKTPVPGDYRVQEEHGGRLQSITPDSNVRSAADQVISAIGRNLLYARVDLVRHEDRWLLMELELIEPSLYFNMDPESPHRFARVLSEWFS